MVEAYDVKARKKVQIKDPKVVQLKNGRYAIKGTSSETGITVMRICGSDKAKAQALIQNLTKMRSFFVFQKLWQQACLQNFLKKCEQRQQFQFFLQENY